MTYIENIFICITIPMIISLFFVKGHSQKNRLFSIIGMFVCLISAYVSSFFMSYFEVSQYVAVIEITPMCEELMKLLPLILYYLIFEPSPNELTNTASAIAVGFATFENVCYLTENGADNFNFLLVRGSSAGALHILCGIFTGICISYVLKRKWLLFTGLIGIFGVCTGFHAIYNLLITASGCWRTVGYLFPMILIICLFIFNRTFPKIMKKFYQPG